MENPLPILSTQVLNDTPAVVINVLKAAAPPEAIAAGTAANTPDLTASVPH